MSLHTFFLYLAAWSLVALSPGPAVLCAMSHATRYGLRPALVGILGIQAGHFVFFGLIAGGLAAVLSTATTAFAVLRLIGAAYLLYLGVRILFSTVRPRAAAGAPAPPPARRKLFWQGFAIQVTNPKALLFMSALLPQFIQPQASLGLQLAILLATTIAVDLVVLTGYACFALHGARSLRGSRLALWLERTFGSALVFFGLRLLAARKNG